MPERATITLNEFMRERFGSMDASPRLSSLDNAIYGAPEPQLDSEIYDTRNVASRMPQPPSALAHYMQQLAGMIRRDSRPDNILAGGLDSASRWLDLDPHIGEDTAWPLGMAGVGALGLGVFGPRSGASRQTTSARPPADHEALARAQAQGFNTDQVWYHGSVASRPFGAFDLARSGSANSGWGAVFLSPNRGEPATVQGAQGYAGRDGHVRELYSRHASPFIWDLDDLSGTLARARQAWPQFDPGRGTGDVWWMRGPDYTREFIDRLRAAGFDSIDMRRRGRTSELAIFDPALLRDVNAAFDPAQRGSSILRDSPPPRRHDD